MEKQEELKVAYTQDGKNYNKDGAEIVSLDTDWSMPSDNPQGNNIQRKSDGLREIIVLTDSHEDALIYREYNFETELVELGVSVGFLSINGRDYSNTDFIIAYANTPDGQLDARRQFYLLEKYNHNAHIINLFGQYESAKEAFEKDRNSLDNMMLEIQTTDIKALAIKQSTEKHKNKNSAPSFVTSMRNQIRESAGKDHFPTGFPSVDKALDGGLHEGLYVIGAISSLGKTTFSLQVADNIAKEGHDVLVFSLEMARTELIAKSVSRNTYKICVEDSINHSNAKTARGIMSGSRYESYSKTELKLIDDAFNRYEKEAQHLYIHEGMGDVGVTQVRETVEKHIKETGNHPVVFIDYLQILAPSSEHTSDKQNTDKSVLELKKISRDFKIPVFAISSFNRTSYAKEVTMSSFKESGAVEYSADVLLGLDLHGVGQKGFDEREAKRENPRKIDFKVLKNRNGDLVDDIPLLLKPQFNMFIEQPNK